MDLSKPLETARQSHELLRSRGAGTSPDEQSSAYRALKNAFDELWVATQQRPDVKEIHRAIGRLITDAEYFAGLNDAEGFRDPAEVWQQYGYLAQAVGPEKA